MKMILKLAHFLTSLTLLTSLTAQPVVKVEVSADTINPGELVEVTYTIENGDGRFEAPELKNMPVVSGPNTSSSFMISNGKKSSSQSYSYILRAVEEGKIIIPEAAFQDGDRRLKIDPVEIIVLKHSNRPSVPPPPDKPTKPIREKKKF
ncbi:MAG TPA: BatD family protein [Saprospiraceae bacterium]|nr:BatD family protein [Saprospiraceae bacterium]